jgi:hypothetical protein
MFKHFTVLLGILIWHAEVFASTVIRVNPDKRIRAVVSYDSMNRIAFANDRIAQVFGDEEAYTLQSDEARGQIFLKPTEANGTKPIYITLTTEQGSVQDIELIPQKIPTSTLILKGEGLQVVSYQDVSVAVYRLTNTSDEGYEVVENTFSGEAVLAIAVEHREIKPKESTRLFVVRAL